MLLNFSVMTQRQLTTALICGEMRTNGYIQRYITSDGYEDELGDYHEGETYLDDEKPSVLPMRTDSHKSDCSKME